MPFRSSQPKSSPPDPDQQSISGTVESVVYHNDETGYTVCTLTIPNKKSRLNAEKYTVVGSCATIWEGEELHAEGTWIRHPQHGLQFQATAITCITPTSTEGIKRYLASGMIKGIGPKYAERIVARFGERTLEVIDKQSGRLREVEGIGEMRRRMIKESWTEQAGIREIMIFLQSHKIGTAKASRIYRRYGADSIAVVKNNPYRLSSDVWGIGFKTADAIALSVGIPRDSEIRARAGILYTLQSEAEEGGHCFSIDADLILHAQELLGISVEILTAALSSQIQVGTIVKEGERIYLRDLYQSEKRVAEKLKRLQDTPVNYPPIKTDAAIAWAENQMHIKLAPSQYQALANALRSKVSIITGGPGVGKTTIVRALTEIFSARRLKVMLAAPTGRAAKRMSEATGMPAQTLHRLLKYNPQEGKFTFNAENPMEGDCFILDETSMMDIRLTDQFLQALKDTVTLILVGDIDQLPSVGPGNVLRDLISSEVIPYCRLNTIFRQDNSGLIVRNAHHVNNGERFETKQGESDFYFIETGEPEKILERAVKLMTERIPYKFHFDPLTEVQVLTPMRKNLLGYENLNAVIQATINPTGPSLVRGMTHFRERDRVMQLRNNYDKEVFNGDVGTIQKVDEAERMLVVLFDGRPVVYQQNELDELILAYACSIHKSQGSEYPAVIVLIHTQHFKLLQRNLLYTAITRGKRLCIVVGSSKAVAIAIKANQVRERRTTLQQRLNPALEPPGRSADPAGPESLPKS
ncbi:MAG: ATP-dependent RecD-like DNA helicase [Kiritimatiellae bacterium]|nr:ATP-dependent RecD-like DNA helicase [Kiritimatiellia bacterium]